MTNKRGDRARPKHAVTLWLLAMAMTVLCSACSRGPEASPESVATVTQAVAASVTSVAVTPPTLSIPVTVQQQLKATELLSNGRKKTPTTGVTWTVSDPKVAGVDSSGLVTALFPGTVSVRATIAGVTGAASITVTAAKLVSVAVTPANKKIQVGTGVNYKAMGTFSDGTSHSLVGAVVWNTSGAGVATIDVTGRATGVAPGTVAVTATHSASGVSGKAFLTVGTAKLSSVAVTPGGPSSPVGLDVPFVATGLFNDGTVLDLTDVATWSSSAAAIATVSNSVDGPGVATAVSVGVTTITATVAGKKGKATLTVTPATLVSIAVSPAAGSLPSGTTLQLVATGTYSDSTTRDVTAVVTWTSSSPAVFVSNATGSAGLASALALGGATIRATDPDTATFGVATLTVTPALLTALAITPPTASVALGVSQQFVAMGTFSDSTTRDVTALVTWSTDTPAVASVSNDPTSAGFATTFAVGATGVVALDPTSGVTASAQLTVTAAVLTGLALDPPSATIASGLTQSFTANGTYSDGTHRDLTTAVSWSIASGTATISNTSPTVGLVTSNGAGLSTVQAVDPTTGITAVATVTITLATVTSISVTPAYPSVPLGATQQFIATGIFTDNTTQDLTASVAWSASNDGAIVSNVPGSNGLATATLAGTTTITATYAPAAPAAPAAAPAAGAPPPAAPPAAPAPGAPPDGPAPAAPAAPPAPPLVSGSTTLTVTSAVLASMAITPPAATVSLGATRQFAVTGIFTDGSTQDLTTSATWASSSPDLLDVSNAPGSNGLSTALAIGAVTLSATDPVTGITGSTTVTVSPAGLVSLDIVPFGKKVAKKQATKKKAPGAPDVETVPLTDSGRISDPLGDSFPLAAIGSYSDGSTVDLTGAVTWTSDSVAATVSNAAANPGLVTTVSVGTATVTATDPATGIAAFIVIEVTTAQLVSIAISPSAPSVPSGLTEQFTAIGTYSDGTTADVTTSVTWVSSGPSAAISNASGSAGLATAVSMGVAAITATDPATGVSGRATMATTAALLRSIVMAPNTAGVTVGATVSLQAIGLYSDGSLLNLTTIVTWLSSQPFAVVSNASGSQGLVTGVLVGSSTIVAMDPTTGIVGTAFIEVLPLPYRTVTATLSDVYLKDDGTQVPTPVPLAPGTTVSAIPLGDGAALPGVLDPTTGNLSIPNVPVGKYWLVVDQRPGGGIITFEEHESSNPNLSNLWSGRPDAAPPTATTNVTFDVTGLVPWQAGSDLLELTDSNAGLWQAPFAAPFQALDLPAGVTSVNQTLDWFTQLSGSLPDSSKGDSLYVHQLSSTVVSTGPAAGRSYARAVAYAEPQNVTVTDGVASTIPAALVPAPQTGSVAANLHTSEFDALSSSLNPSATPAGLSFYVDASAHLATGASSLWGTPDMLAVQLPPGTPDVDFGTLTYGQFLGSPWQEFVLVEDTWNISWTATGATNAATRQLKVGSMYPSSNLPALYAPQVGPAASPRIAGLDAFQQQTGVGTTPALTFDAPALGSPTSYLIEWRRATKVGARTRLLAVASQLEFPSGGQTTFSVTLPAGILASGTQYYAVITAIQSANVIDAGGVTVTARIPPLHGPNDPVHYATTMTALFAP